MRTTAQYRVGQHVRATCVITEDGGPPNFYAESFVEDGGWVHALPGDFGEVIHWEAGEAPTVRFDRTGTATCCGDAEIVTVGFRGCKVCGDGGVPSYMVQDMVWESAGLDQTDVAHPWCLEERLGRTLTRQDFTEAKVNQVIRWALSNK